jgi:hypothetical protein
MPCLSDFYYVKIFCGVSKKEILTEIAEAILLKTFFCIFKVKSENEKMPGVRHGKF